LYERQDHITLKKTKESDSRSYKEEGEMTKALAVFTVTMICLCLSVIPAFGDNMFLKEEGHDKWSVHDEKDNLVCTITRTQDKGYRIEDPAGTFGGNIWSNGNWTPPGAWRKRRLVITPEAAQLYLNGLEALRAKGIL
jgi:hypothetical protein